MGQQEVYSFISLPGNKDRWWTPKELKPYLDVSQGSINKSLKLLHKDGFVLKRSPSYQKRHYQFKVKPEVCDNE